METRQPSFWAAALITYLAALVAFLLRLVARKIKGVHFFFDDYLALVAFIFTTGFTTVNLYKLHFGLGLHLKDIPVSYAQASHDYFKLLWIDSWFYTLSIGLSKVTVLGLYWRIFGRSNIKRPIQVLVVCCMLWISVRVIIIPLQCNPLTKYWDRHTPGHCPVQTNIFFFASTFPHLIMEIALVVLPVLEIRKLKMPRMQKIAVGAMFASGTIVCVASLIQLIQAFLLDAHSEEIWWVGAPQLMSSIVEVNLGHFSTSLPNLRPILDCLANRTPTSSYSRTFNTRPSHVPDKYMNLRGSIRGSSSAGSHGGGCGDVVVLADIERGNRDEVDVVRKHGDVGGAWMGWGGVDERLDWGKGGTG